MSIFPCATWFWPIPLLLFSLILDVLGVFSSLLFFAFLAVDLFLSVDADESFGEDEEECGGVEVLLLDKERRDRGRI